MAVMSSFKRYIGMKDVPAAAKIRSPGGGQVDAGDFAQLVISMGRLLNHLDAQPALAKERLGLAEWVSLTVLARSGKLTERQFAKALAVPGRRGREIIASLQRAARISCSAPAGTVERSIELTEAGSTSLAKANAELIPALEAVLKGRERMLATINRQLRLLTRVGRSPKQST
jgi:hypothetical protein